jgi:hypothetical protein
VSLVAVEQTGRRWEAALAPADVQRVHAMLDEIDGRLADPPALRRIPRFVLARAIAIATIVIAIGLGQLGLLIAALVAAARPFAALLAAAGVGAVTAAALALRDQPLPWVLLLCQAVPLGGLGLTLVAIAFGMRRDREPPRLLLFVGVIVMMAAAAAAALLQNGIEVVRLYQSARSVPAAAVLLLAAGAALALRRNRESQYAALALVVAGGACAAMGSTSFLDRFGRDPLLVRSAPLVWKTVASEEPAADFSLSFYAAEVRLASDGRSVAAVESTDDEDESMAFHIGRAGGNLTRVQAEDLVFVDEDTVLTVQRDDDGMVLTARRIDAPRDRIWSQRVPDVYGTRLSADATTRRWQLFGWDRHNIVRARGFIGGQEIHTARWPLSNNAGAWTDAIAGSGDAVLGVDRRNDRGLLERAATWWPWVSPMAPYRSESTVWIAQDGRRVNVGTSKLDTQCFATVLDDDRLLCVAFDGMRTHFSAVAASGTIHAIAWTWGRFMPYGTVAHGFISGWLDSSPVVLRPATREMMRADPNRGVATQLSATDGWIATVSFDGTASRVRMFRLNPTAAYAEVTPAAGGPESLLHRLPRSSIHGRASAKRGH